MIENAVQASNPDRGTASPGAAVHPESITIAQLARTILESTLLQAKFNQSIMARIQDLANGILQTHEILQKLSRDLDQRVQKLAVDNPAGGRFAAPVGDDLLLTKVLSSFLMYVEASDMSVTPHLVADGCWERAITQAFVARLKPGMTVIDVGANYGYYSLIAASCVGENGRVYAFEPNPRTYALLKKNVEVNCVGSIMQTHQLAILDSRKQVELHVLRRFQGSSSLFVPELVPEPDPPPEERPLVKAVPLDEMIREKVDLIKIDAEGSEPLVLEGMRGILNRNPHLTIFMEINIPMIRQATDPKGFLKKIRELGGTIHYFTPWNTVELFEEEKVLRFPLYNLLIEKK